jgi:hypothetical protein
MRATISRNRRACSWGANATGLATSTLLVDPTLTRERLRPGPGAKFYATDPLIPVAWLGQYVVVGLDVGRFHWSDTVPFAAQVAALVIVALGMAFGIWATVVNRFFSACHSARQRDFQSSFLCFLRRATSPTSQAQTPARGPTSAISTSAPERKSEALSYHGRNCLIDRVG